MCFLPAYGGFHGTYWDSASVGLRVFANVGFAPVFVYLIASWVLERRGFALLGPLMYLGAFVLVTPSIGVMGEFGPAHVAVGIAAPLWYYLMILLGIKVVMLAVRGTLKKRTSQEQSMVGQGHAPGSVILDAFAAKKRVAIDT